MLKNLGNSEENKLINIKVMIIGGDGIIRISKVIDIKTTIPTKVNITVEVNIIITGI